jgi:uncharacterized membrane protein SpoIIM required for sporulation/uncharacterized RDD family membrane protein YckC
MRAAPVLRVRSDTGVDVAFAIAGPGARMQAFVLDAAIRYGAAALTWLGAAVGHSRLAGGRWSLDAPFEPGASWFLLVVAPPLAIVLLYHPLCEWLLAGRTPGKRAAGVRVVLADGRPPGPAAALLRNAFRLLDSLPLLYGVGLASAWVDAQHRRIGDLAAGTLLVYEPRRPSASELLAAGHSGWLDLPRHLEALRARDPRRPLADALALVESLGPLAQDLQRERARAGERPGTTPRVAPLEALHAALHLELHGRRPSLAATLATLFGARVPATARALRGTIAGVALLFGASVLGGWLLVRTDAAFAGLFASREMIATLSRGELWTEGLLGVLPSSVVSAQILVNNVAVNLSAFVFGTLFGLGTFYIVALNGLSIGALFALAAQHGVAQRLFAFVVPHGLVEFACLCVSGAAGVALGRALVRPGGATRLQSFSRAALDAGGLLAPVLLLLGGCGLIEGYVSPRDDLPLAARVAIGVGYGALMLALLAGWPGRSATRSGVRTMTSSHGGTVPASNASRNGDGSGTEPAPAGGALTSSTRTP